MALVKMRSYWNRVGPNPVTNVLIRRPHEKDRQTDGQEAEPGGMWPLAKEQGWLVAHKQRQDKVRQDPPLEPSLGVWPSQPLDFGLLVSTR